MQFLIRTVHIHRPTRLLGLMGAVLGLSSWSARWWAGANTYFREIGAALGSADSGLDADVLTTEPVRSFPDDVQQLVITSYHHALRESGAWCGVTPLSAPRPRTVRPIFAALARQGSSTTRSAASTTRSSSTPRWPTRYPRRRGSTATACSTTTRVRVPAISTPGRKVAGRRPAGAPRARPWTRRYRPPSARRGPDGCRDRDER